MLLQAAWGNPTRRALVANEAARSVPQSIVDRNARGEPAWDTGLGGAIGLHGGGVATDWTLGCIALENAAIEELWVALRHGSRVVIDE